MYEDYKKLRTTLEEILTGAVDRQAANKVLKDTINAQSPDELYSFLDCEHHSAQIAVILSLMGVSRPTATDMDKAEAILQQIQKAKEL